MSTSLVMGAVLNRRPTPWLTGDIGVFLQVIGAGSDLSFQVTPLFFPLSDFMCPQQLNGATWNVTWSISRGKGFVEHIRGGATVLASNLAQIGSQYLHRAWTEIPCEIMPYFIFQSTSQNQIDVLARYHWCRYIADKTKVI